MRLREYFAEKEQSEEDETEQEKKNVNNMVKEKKRSNFTPKPGRDKWLDSYIEAVKKDVVEGVESKIEMNLSGKEEKALKTLLMDDSIVIRPADKGSGIVVIDTEKYIESLEAEMEKSKSYKQASIEQYHTAEKLVRKTVNKMHMDGHIGKEMKKYLIPKLNKPGKLKGNPKLHKKGKPMRTIVSGRDTPTENMAEIAEGQLNQYVEEFPSFIKDTTDFLSKLNEMNDNLPHDAILFCFDVEKLYPSIPKKEGLQACREALEQREDKTISTIAVMEMIKTVLDNNVFGFNNKQYIQTDGVAIGSKLGRNYACAYMRKWDEELSKFEKQPAFYVRYIDDGFGIWTHGEQSLNEFHKFANTIHPSIKVELRYSKEKIEFLDTMVIVENNTLETDLYCKPTDKHIYLHKDSNHPTSVKKSLPYGMGIRIRRICSRETDYQKRRKELKIQLRKRGYSGKFIEREFRKVDNLERSNLLKYNANGKKKNRVPLVITYSKHLPDIQKITRNHMNLLYKSPKMETIFSDPPIVAFKRDRNLTDILVHGKLNKVFKSRDNSKERCGKDCVVCEILDQGDNCKTRNTVYGIKCGSCDKIMYVGETERTLAERAKEHLADIKHRRNKTVANHFNSNNHSEKDVTFSILEKCFSNSMYYRKGREIYWMEKLNTFAPFGLNIKSKLGILWPDYESSAHLRPGIPATTSTATL